MKKQQSGFAVVELIVVLVIVVAVAGVGYYVWHGRKTNNPPITTASSNYQSPPVTMPTAPQINNTSDLNSAMTALNQTSVSSSNTDSSQLTTQANGF
jgi:flagellar basal body-associated protein FliL